MKYERNETRHVKVRKEVSLGGWAGGSIVLARVVKLARVFALAAGAIAAPSATHQGACSKGSKRGSLHRLSIKFLFSSSSSFFFSSQNQNVLSFNISS